MGNQTATNKLGGICGTDYFQKMKDKYGDDAVKFVVIHKCKQLVNTKFSNIGSQISKVFNEIETNTNNVSQQKIREIRQAFDCMKSQINQAVPGGVQKLQQSKGQMLQEAINLEKYTRSIIQLKQQTLTQIESQRNRVNDDIKSKHQMIIDSIQKQCPSIPIYYDMPQANQKKIMKKGEVQFSAQIQSKKQQIYRHIDQQINTDQIKQALADIVPYKAFNQLASSPKELFSSDHGITKDVIQRLKEM